MLIELSPVAQHTTTIPPVITLEGLLLTVGNTTVDLSLIPEGGQAEAEEDSPLVGICTREKVTVKYPYSTDLYEPMQPTDREAYQQELLSGGTVVCPLIKREVAHEL